MHRRHVPSRQTLNDTTLIPFVPFVGSDFHGYKSGVVQCLPGRHVSTMHAMAISGWGKQGGVEYWLVMNTFGTGWGDQGHGRISIFGDNACHLGFNTIAGYVDPNRYLTRDGTFA